MKLISDAFFMQRLTFYAFRHDRSSIEDEDNEEDEAGAGEGGDGGPTESGSREEDTAGGEEGPSLVITKDELTRCPCCRLGVWTPLRVSEARYISLSLRMVSFNGLKSHPGHFHRTVPAHTKVHGLIGQIRGHTGIHSTSLGIYREPSTCPQSALPAQLSLEECGFNGGPHHSPTSAFLYYDYSVEFSDCPILNCDHYINFRKL
ncbi:uncharacterized protein LOC129708471 isoform X2 [Leucoraja erinacea]|uniref:uncharacterized protein LOC129708471 isoform X2 n=1 Tax=Leucoraja erinaceus TaxID=7782 RepID=UPI002454421F|nr:uncharacterized protein LOC129708471 isoform X2 [Leucoraja erinacea]